MYTVTIYPQMAQYAVKKHQTVFDALVNNGLTIDTPCGGNGTCGKCKVQIIAGDIPEASAEEYHHLSEQDIAKGIRFSCQLVPAGDLTIRMMRRNDENLQILSGGYTPDFEPTPYITKEVHQRKVTLTAQYRSCLDLVSDVLDISALIEQPEFLRYVRNVIDCDLITAVYADKRLIGLEGGDSRDENYGLAIDIGTTTIVVSLIDLNEAVEIDSSTGLNPQKVYGQDVLSRIDFARRAEKGLEILHTAIIECLNSIIGSLCDTNNVARENIYDITVAANTTMLHLLLGVDPTPIGKSPYVPVFTRRQSFPAVAFGLQISPFGRLYCLPNVSAYIGADIVAGVNVCQLMQIPHNVLFIDIGTNGEIVLSQGGKVYACACAAGPALEGMNISCGMLAGEGAVERLQITECDIRLQVIGGGKPKGVCGSGVIEAISEIVRVGLIEKSGRLKSQKDVLQDDKLKGLARFLVEVNNKRVIMLDPENNILITQADIRQVQLAKGAILSGIHALLNQLAMNMGDLDEIIISGQFGKHLRVDSLVGLGLLPRELGEKVTYIGNSSQMGAMMCLLSTANRKHVENTAEHINHFELSMLEDYEKLFSGCLKFQ
jgi:uncharacterized 2Fe-2S/4Fe-4S cluster protein (DUF4445 family)